jgi:hypothetical protein
MNEFFGVYGVAYTNDPFDLGLLTAKKRAVARYQLFAGYVCCEANFVVVETFPGCARDTINDAIVMKRSEEIVHVPYSACVS